MVVKRIRSQIPAPRNLTGHKKILFRDPAGNTLYAKKGKTTGAQFWAKNAEGKLVNHNSCLTLMRRWNRNR